MFCLLSRLISLVLTTTLYHSRIINYYLWHYFTL